MIGNDWDKILAPECEKPYFKQLIEFLSEDMKHYEIYPPIANIFDAFKYCSYAETKIVIIGQDPYINPGQAHGLSFSVQPESKIPPSLMNIFIELKDDCGCYIPNNGCLIPWAKQGVLLLNTVLTVRRGMSNSHAGMGWEIFTDTVIRKLSDERNKSIIFMLWGNKAKKKTELIDHEQHLVLKASHPSPLAGGGFFGCKHFSTASQYLYEITNDTIDWQIPNIDR